MKLAALLLVWWPAAIMAVRLYPNMPDPAANPQASRHWIKAPPASVFPRNRARFSGYRGGCSDAAFAAYAAQGTGDVWWPQYPVLQHNASAIAQCLALVDKYKLAVVDISNYVPARGQLQRGALTYR